MSKQTKLLMEAEEMDKQNFDWEAEMDYIRECEERAYAQRELEHKVAMKDVALRHALVMSLAGIVVDACF